MSETATPEVPAAPVAAPAPAAAPAAAAPPAAPAAAPAPAAAAPAPAPAGPPEKYDFKAPEGAQAFDDKVLAAYGEGARELNLTQEQAQGFLAKVGNVIRDRQVEQHQAAVKAFYEPLGGTPDTWEAQTKADKEIGGDKLAENLHTAKKFADMGGPEFVKLLDAFGLSNHPTVIKTFVRYGKAVSPDTSFVSGSGTPKRDYAPGERLYAKKS
jgi:hypothetical protein